MKKDFIVLGIIAAVVVLIASVISIQLQGDYYQADLDDITEASDTIFLSIECTTIFDNYDKLDDTLKDDKYLPPSGYILERTEFAIRVGDSVLDILRRVTKAYKIHLDVSNFAEFGSAYVLGINHIYEYSCGALSGWMFSVNGSLSTVGISNYKIKDGDDIRIMYTCNLGYDLDFEASL